MNHTMNVYLEILGPDGSAGEIKLCVDFAWTPGTPAHMGSLTYAGHPAEGPEVEIQSMYWPTRLPDDLEAAITVYIQEHYQETGG